MDNRSGRKDPASSRHYLESRLDAANYAVLEHLFSHHAPKRNEVLAMEEIREKAKELAAIILIHAPACEDTSAAIRKLREAVHAANAAIVLDGVSI